MTSPKMSARKALEIHRKGHPDRHVGWDDVAALEQARVEYARACAILAALVDECEAMDAESSAENIAAWGSAIAKRRALERGEES